MKGITLADRVGRLGWMLAAVLIAAAWAASGVSAQTPTLNTLVSFNGSDGSAPEDRGGLIADAHGNLFGTAGGGGAYNLGTVFEIKVDSTTATGYATTPTTLVSFNGSDGANPYAGLIADASGNLFGTTSGQYSAAGTVFEIKVDSTTATGYAATPTTLVSFNGSDGSDPYAGLIADGHGNLFGTTLLGGNTSYYGTVFELKVDNTTATGYAATPTTLVSFNGTDGLYPFAGLIADASGNLFGVTEFGGTPGYGTVFEVKVDSTTATGYATMPTTLVSFNGNDGAYSEATLITDSHGNLFGTTSKGGAYGYGTVFELKTDSTTATGYASTPTTLVSFNGTDPYPFAGLIADASGNLFGVTSGLFTTGFGTAFEIKTDSTTATGYATTPTTLDSFNGTDGAYPIEVLIADAHGNLFGTAEGGGKGGTVFEVTGSGFVPPTVCGETPGVASCHAETISCMAHSYGGIAHAAASLGYASVTALQNAVAAYCGN